MANTGPITVQVHLDIDLNGEQLQVLYEQPATAILHDGERGGITVQVHMDGAKLAKALLPHITREWATAARLCTADGRAL